MKIMSAKINNMEFIIDDDDTPETGFYLFIYKDGKGTHDYLQDDIDMCKKMALEDFGVPLESWKMEEAKK